MPALALPAIAGLVLVAVVAGAVAAVAGFGIGSLVTPALALAVGTKVAVALTAIPHAVATAVRLWGLRASVDRGVLLRFGLASAAGGLAGALLHATLASPLLTLVLGALLVLSGLSELTGWARALRLGGWSAVAAGVLSGLFGGLVGNQGGIRSAALLRFGLPRESLVATATAIALLVDAARLPIYMISSGDAIGEHAPLVIALTVAVVIGTLVGVPILRRLPERTFRGALASLLVVLGIGLIAAAAAAAA
jgi:uncharacterized protein